MISYTTKHFRKLLKELPKEIKKHAIEVYSQFRKDPYYPSLHFKRVHSRRPIFAVRISKNYRALGVQYDDEIIWFWVGSHSDYEKVLRQLKHI